MFKCRSCSNANTCLECLEPINYKINATNECGCTADRIMLDTGVC